MNPDLDWDDKLAMSLIAIAGIGVAIIIVIAILDWLIF